MRHCTCVDRAVCNLLPRASSAYAGKLPSRVAEVKGRLICPGDGPYDIMVFTERLKGQSYKTV